MTSDKSKLTKPSMTSSFAQERIIPLLNALALLRRREQEKLKNSKSEEINDGWCLRTISADT